MSGNESVADELYELGIDLVNPGGSPEKLRQAAKAWRRLQKQVVDVGSVLQDVDKAVERTVGDTWRGPAADAFQKHWREVREAVEKSTQDYGEVAKQLDEAADQIEEVNSEIHGIYVEIGVSVAVGVALSFVTVGLGSAAAATRVATLAARAIRISERLGRLLRGIATHMRTYQRAGNLTKLLTGFGVNWAGNTFGSAFGAAAVSGDGLDGANLLEATWQGGVAAAVGTPLGMGSAGWVGARLAGMPAVGTFGVHAGQNVAGGVVGNVGGGGAVDGISAAHGEKPEWLRNSLVNAAGGGLGGVGMGAVGAHQQRAVSTPVATPPGFDRSKLPGGGRRGEGPHFAIDVPMGGVGAAIAGGGGEVAGSGGAAEEPAAKVKTEAGRRAGGNPPPPRQRSIRDDFG